MSSRPPSGILNWLLAGYRMWKEQGLGVPEAVKQATEEWRDSEDWLARFLEERTETADCPDEFVPKSDLYKAFTRWAEGTKDGRGISDKQFTEKMKKKGHEAKVVKRQGKMPRVWLGLRFRVLGGWQPPVGLEDVL